MQPTLTRFKNEVFGVGVEYDVQDEADVEDEERKIREVEELVEGDQYRGLDDELTLSYFA